MGLYDAQPCLEGPEEHAAEALELVKMHMENPFEFERGGAKEEEGKEEEKVANVCDVEACGGEKTVNLCDVELVVDGDTAKTWFDAK